MKLYRGYISLEPETKRPTMKWNREEIPDDGLLTKDRAAKYSDYGAVLATETALVDIDNSVQAQRLFAIIKAEGLKCRVMKTDRGLHFLFSNSNRRLKKCAGNARLMVGLAADIKVGLTNSYEKIKAHGVERVCIYGQDLTDTDQLDPVPIWLKPICKADDLNSCPDFPTMADGDGRNNALYNYAFKLQRKNIAKDEVKHICRLINDFVMETPLSSEELALILRKDALNVEPDPIMVDDYADRPPILLTSLEDIEETRAEWLIDGYIPKNQITILAGDGGSGKTSIWCALAAAVSSGRSSILEEGEPEEFRSDADPAKVIYFSSEDSSKYVLKKRLRQAGAVMSNILTVDMAADSFGALKFNSPELREILETVRPKLCIFDPLQAFVPDKINMGYRNEMRNQLAPLISYGEQFGTTFLIVMHANKQSGVWGRKRMADSSDMWDIARSVLMVGQTGEQEQRYISQEKCNYGPLQKTVLFDIADGCTKFVGYTDKKDRDFMIRAAFDRPTPTGDMAEEMITMCLEDSGEMTIKTLQQIIEGGGIGKKTFDSARRKMEKAGKVATRCVGMGRGKGTTWLIRLSGQPQDYQAPEEAKEAETA